MLTYFGQVRSLLCLGFLLVNFQLQAATIVVDSTNQQSVATGAECTLGAAIESANADAAIDGCSAGSGADTITLPAGTYTVSDVDTFDTVSSMLPTLNSNMTIQGAGAATTIIDTPDNNFKNVVHVKGAGTISLSDLTIDNGEESGQGGGNIYCNNSATLNLTRVIVRDATLVGGAVSGAGMRNIDCAVNITDSYFLNNTINGSNGGAIYMDGGTLTVDGSTFSGNEDNQNSKGGAIYLGGGTATITNSTFYNNDAETGGGAGVGGAIYNNGATLTLTHVTIKGNNAGTSAGGLYHNAGTTTLNNTIISGNTADADPDGEGNITSGGGNIIGTHNFVGLGITDNLGIDPLDGVLIGTLSGRLTPTFIIPDNSVAIDFSSANCEADDQNDETRDVSCDAGATEAVCGDGVVHTISFGEECDDGTNNSDVTADACRSDCTEASCGDGVVDTGESCDDGNNTNGDGCSSVCATEVDEDDPEEEDEGDDDPEEEAEDDSVSCVITTPRDGSFIFSKRTEVTVCCEEEIEADTSNVNGAEVNLTSSNTICSAGSNPTIFGDVAFSYVADSVDISSGTISLIANGAANTSILISSPQLNGGSSGCSLIVQGVSDHQDGLGAVLILSLFGFGWFVLKLNCRIRNQM